jgi:hypothetical protein
VYRFLCSPLSWLTFYFVAPRDHSSLVHAVTYSLKALEHQLYFVLRFTSSFLLQESIQSLPCSQSFLPATPFGIERLHSQAQSVSSSSRTRSFFARWSHIPLSLTMSQLDASNEDLFIIPKDSQCLQPQVSQEVLLRFQKLVLHKVRSLKA